MATRDWVSSINRKLGFASSPNSKDEAHVDTLRRLLGAGLAGRSLREVFGSASDEFWLWCFTAGYRQEAAIRAVVPSFPPDDVQRRFAGTAGDDTMIDAFSFYSLVKSLVAQHAMTPPESILEFGCGWGRIIRFFLKDVEPSRLWGIDCMPQAIELCASTNPYARFELVDPFPPAPVVPDGSFDVVYSYSVFSHLSEDAHMQWLREFTRILKPGGILIATTRPRDFILYCESLRAANEQRDFAQGTALAFKDTREALARFDRGEYLYEGMGAGGVLDASFFGETCIPMGYVLEQWTKLFDFIGYIDDRRMCVQNVIVVRKPA